MASSDRVLDIVLLGATGYTGTICAEHIIKTFPTSLRWAIVGRSLEALEHLSDKLKVLNPDRVHPGKSFHFPVHCRLTNRERY